MPSLQFFSLLATTYLLPSLLLNPVLLLHAFNLLLSNLFGPLSSADELQAPPTRILVYDSTPVYPYADVHASDRLCWSYTAVMVLVQLVFYLKVGLGRERDNDMQTPSVKAPSITCGSALLSNSGGSSSSSSKDVSSLGDIELLAYLPRMGMPHPTTHGL